MIEIIWPIPNVLKNMANILLQLCSLNLWFQSGIIHEIWIENNVEGSILGHISCRLPTLSRRNLWNTKRLCHFYGCNFRHIANNINIYMLWNIYMLKKFWALKRYNVLLRIYCIRLSFSRIFGTKIYWLRVIYDWVKSLLLCLSYWISGRFSSKSFWYH